MPDMCESTIARGFRSPDRQAVMQSHLGIIQISYLFPAFVENNGRDALEPSSITQPELAVQVESKPRRVW